MFFFLQDFIVGNMRLVQEQYRFMLCPQCGKIEYDGEESLADVDREWDPREHVGDALQGQGRDFFRVGVQGGGASPTRTNTSACN